MTSAPLTSLRLPRQLLASLALVLPVGLVPTAAGSAANGPVPSPHATAPDPYALTPQRRALLATIRYAEGTWTGGNNEGYRVLYGGGRFQSLARHPEITVHRRYSSAAAGAYQFLPATWRAAARKLGLHNFGPRNQDMAALFLVEQRGVLAKLDRQGLSATVLDRLAREWASLPTHAGRSYYGQPVKNRRDLQAFYARQLSLALHPAAERRDSSPIAG